jgi:hypothetical protein
LREKNGVDVTVHHRELEKAEADVAAARSETAS